MSAKLVDGTLRRRSKHTRLVKRLNELLSDDVLSTKEIMDNLNETWKNSSPSQQRVVNILTRYPEFIRINSRKERPALWGLR
jgi:hypothetical protein